MKVTVKLKSTPSTGYKWIPDREPDVVDHSPLTKPDDGRLFYSPSVTIPFVFSNIQPGMVLNFGYQRPWQKNVEPHELVSVRIGDTAQDDAENVQVEVVLTGCRSTGYYWESDRKPTSITYAERYPVIVGQSLESFSFDSMPLGTVLTFNNRRPWEKNSQPQNVAYVLVENDQ